MNSSGYIGKNDGFDHSPVAKLLINLEGWANRKTSKMFGVTEKIREGNFSRTSESFWGQNIYT